MRAALDCSATGLLAFDDGQDIIFCSRAAAPMLGLPPDSCKHPTTLAGLLDASSVLEHAGRAAFAAAFGPAAPAAIMAIPLPCGETLQLSVGDRRHEQRVAVLERKPRVALPAERTDGLTGLSDRAWLHARLQALLAETVEPEHVAVLMIDLDRFKAVNDSYGHPIGDKLLQLVSRRLRSAVREDDVVSRLGGDEFAVVMTVAARAETLGARLVELLSHPYLIEGQVIVIGASVGLAIGHRDGEDAASLLQAADLALYQAKAEGRRAVRVFHRSLGERARARTNLLIDLRRALPLQQFELHFQPQTKLKSGKLIGFEALIRWRHPELGLVPPDRFIPIAEESGLIIPIGEWVLRTACRQAGSWPGELTVAVNVSPKQLAEPERLQRAVRSAITSGGIPPCRLEIEVTESSLTLPGTAALDALHAIRGLGVRVSMDDFGTGYSSLSQLRSFPFDKLKIDRSFLADVESNADSVAVIRAIAALGASLGITTTAEGVETAEQAAIIRADGCSDMQGYLVSRPVPEADVLALIARLTQLDGPDEIILTPPLKG